MYYLYVIACLNEFNIYNVHVYIDFLFRRRQLAWQKKVMHVLNIELSVL